MNLIISASKYKIDESIKVYSVIATDSSYIYKNERLSFGYIEYKGDFIQILGTPDTKANLAIVIEYNTFKFAFLFDDIIVSKDDDDDHSVLSDLIKRLINE